MKLGNQISMFEGNHKFKFMKPIRLIELFGGIGAQAKALERLEVDFEHYKLCEIDKYAVKSYNAIHGTNFEPSDITKIHAADLEIIETDKYDYLMTYSFPCQDLSSAGKGAGMAKGSGTRSGLLWEVERLLTEQRERGNGLPQVLLMENVPKVIGEKNIGDFSKWVEFLDGLEYKSKWALLNAKDYGIPQNRNRCFMISILGDYYYEFPQPKPLKLKLKDLLDFDVTYRIDFSSASETVKNCIKLVATKVEKDISKCVRRSGLKSRDRHEWACYSVDLRQTERFNRIMKNYSKTICVQHKGSYTLDGRVYYDYSTKEVFRLMDFDDEDFYRAKAVGISDSQLYKQAGNSIVIAVLEAILGEML